ncbi:hypothetical protein Tco_0971700 [Tanacetum coccineum]
MSHEMHQEEQLNFDVDSDIDDNTISYHQYQVDSEVKTIPTEEQSMVNDSLRVELARYKQEMLEEKNVLLKSKLSQNVESINSLKNESKKVVSEKKDLEERYLEEIVCLKSANKVATEILQRFQQPTQTLPMLTKRPNLATHDLHKIALGSNNPWTLKQAKLSQPTLYDGHALLNTTHSPVRVHDSEDSLVNAKVSRTKMSKRLGTIKPINYAELNALYNHFVPQKELSREQVYWLPAAETTSQSSTPAKPVTPFVRIFWQRYGLQHSSENPKYWLLGMTYYQTVSKYVPPSKRANWEKHQPLLPKIKQLLFRKPPRIQIDPHRTTQMQQNKKPNVSLLNLSTRTKPATESRNLCQRSILGNHHICLIAWRPTGKVVGSVKPQWKPTERHFTLYDKYPLTMIVEPIVEPLELTPCVSSSSTVTMISRVTDCTLSDRKAGSKGISDEKSSLTPNNFSHKQFVLSNMFGVTIQTLTNTLSKIHGSLFEGENQFYCRSKGRTVADSIAERLTRPTAYKFKTDCSIIPVWRTASIRKSDTSVLEDLKALSWKTCQEGSLLNLSDHRSTNEDHRHPSSSEDHDQGVKD